ncbi:hypothetical protein DUNSADRAFT_15145 [Dunaliella salina]|uniref:FYVE-type domain-containing protein n=1 Tax=Dunaliella salina TaxID=3046 RepID=A0ABQ7G614_DUNSA|nr:hypothetical protein DUNSADRAFT_15145 [Dunaliella salina]|eukprot:KAF5830036.1 hypothetical protein DUNSADRAFT_15145 [Dunaliella salina]
MGSLQASHGCLRAMLAMQCCMGAQSRNCMQLNAIQKEKYGINRLHGGFEGEVWMVGHAQPDLPSPDPFAPFSVLASLLQSCNTHPTVLLDTSAMICPPETAWSCQLLAVASPLAYANDLQQERAAAQPPPFSCLSPLLAKGGPSMHPTSQPMPSFYPYGPPGCGELDRDVSSQGVAATRGVPVPGSPSLRAARHHCSVPSSFAGSSPYGSSPTDARLPHYPGSYSPLESFVPFSRRTANGSDCGGYCQEELGGEEGGPCTEPRLKSHPSNNSLGGAESPQLSSSPGSFSSNAMVVAHQGGQGLTAYASGGNGLAPAAAAAATAAAMRQLMELLPPQWLPDSMATACGGCHKPFRPLVRLRHHCRCCGRIFCQACSGAHVLLPPKFNSSALTLF